MRHTWPAMTCLILCFTATSLPAAVLTGAGNHLPIPVPNPGNPDRAHPVYTDTSSSTFDGTWSPPAHPDWVGTFSGTGSRPGTPDPGAATIDFAGLRHGYLPAGSIVGIGDVDNGTGLGEAITFQAFGASGSPLDKFLNEPFAVNNAASAAETPGWQWHAASQEYEFFGNTVLGNPSVGVAMKTNQDIYVLEVFRATIGFGYAVDAPLKPRPAAVNTVQDCWTTNLDLDPDVERELYTFDTTDPIDFVWKHKILESCSAYSATIRVFPCRDGKPRMRGADVVRMFRRNFGPVAANPAIPEQLKFFTAPAGALPPGRYDYVVQTECDDTNGRVRRDGDVDDQCGMTPGGKPMIMGPQPAERWDPDPGGSPPGRGPGEEGTTRGWCFEVTPPPC